mmetsp:Transcript_15197/g.29214  ORF Transcript_15197/g.29214 Transcript_15197/m.29214 type:complete len:331 (+) Transcript_15197:72-1064(+)
MPTPIPTNENVEPSSAPLPTSKWKAPVPSTDYRAALRAIDNQASISKSDWTKKHPGVPDDRRDFFLHCIDKTADSLKKQLEETALPAEETEVERVLDSFKYREISTLPPASPGTDEDDDSVSSSSSLGGDEDEDYEFDDDEIIDQDAYAKVKQLRIQARETVMRVIALRERVSEGAMAVTQKSLEELLRVHGFSDEGVEGENITSEVDGNDANSCENCEADRDEMNPDSRLIDPMNTALRCLTDSLQNVDSGLLQKLESMKETMKTIDSSIEKYQRLSQGDENVLTQTEKALYSVVERKEFFANTREVMEEEETPMSDDAKLAFLLAGAL